MSAAILQEKYEIHIFNRSSYSEKFTCLDAKEAWEKFIFKVERWPLYRVWFVSGKETVVDKPKAL